MSQVAYKKLKRFVAARLAPGEELGLHLTVGLVLLFVAVYAFHELAEDMRRDAGIAAWDLRLAQWLHLHAFEPLTSFMLVVTQMHSVAGILVLTSLLALYLWRRGERYWLLTLLIVVPPGMLLNVALKYSYQRARPYFDEPLLTLATYSFPSGHTAAATLFYGVLASYLVMKGRRWWAVPGAVAMVLLVACSRMYLGVHYLSDVLAAMMEGVAWLAICLTGVSTWRRRRENGKQL
ncbi:phosphatase PAP2 family protein [Pseudoduganella sp. RAF19]